MIPNFDENGNLPPGIHAATLDEIEDRFCKETEVRRVQMQSLRWLVEMALRAGAQKIVVNGSFVTDVFEPNDVDCALLLDPSAPKDQGALDELALGPPFIQVYVVEDVGYNYFTTQFYATDRLDRPKGMLEVNL
jgi:hypothetical protein